MSDLVERVTRALDTWVDPDRVRDAIAVVLEKAAKVADGCDDGTSSEGPLTAYYIAAAIRALKGE